MAITIGGKPLGNGVNVQPSYYPDAKLCFGWKLMKQQSKIKSVRIEIEPEQAGGAALWIAEAQSEGYQVIATYHNHTVLGSNDTAELLKAANWWKDNYHNLGGNFIINLMNEWGDHQLTANQYASTYNQAIAIVRTVYNGPLIIDLPGWGQAAHVAFEVCHNDHGLITDSNIVLSAHLYSNSWNEREKRFVNKHDINVLDNTGRPCIIGEFGSGPGNGGCNWAECVDHARSKGWPVIGWCWNGDGNNLNMVTPSWNNDRNAQSFEKSSYFDTVYDRL